MMGEYVTLMGAEDVLRAGRTISSAADLMLRAGDTVSGSADLMLRAADNIEGAFRQHQNFMDDWLQRFEAIVARGSSDLRCAACKSED
jgi:hypothetical protein